MAGRLVSGRYRLHSILGRGGMAQVWRGVDERLDRPVAVKILDVGGTADSAAVPRFEREALAIARLSHPNVVAVHDVGVDQDLPYLVMELVDGQSLAALLAAGPMDVGDAVDIAVQVCDALQAAHDAGVVHRDVKPANILITAAGSVKVLDFGVARVPRTGRNTVTEAAVTVGTGAFMAPEQATGGPVDARTDLYALGCVLYAMLTGGPPFQDADPMRVLWQQVHQHPAPISALRRDVPADLDGLIGRLLAKNPADRPDTAAEVRDRLAHHSGQPVPRTIGNAAAAPRPAHGHAAVPPAHRHAAAAAAPPVRGHAAVLSPTQTMPVVDIDAQPDGTAAGRFRLGPAGIAAVALAAAVVTALAVAVLTVVRPGPQAAAPATPGVSTSAAATAAPSTPADPVAAAEAAVQAQVQAGTLDARAARDLTKRLDDIARQVTRGDLDRAAESAAQLRTRLDELRDDDKVTAAGYDAILSNLDLLTRSLPTAGNRDD